MNEMKNLPADEAAVIGTVRGLAFAVTAAVYMTIGGNFGGYLWCVYLGFLLTMALGSGGKRWLNYGCSLAAGYGYAYLFFGIKGAMLFFFRPFAATVISEFFITLIILWIHLAVLRKSPVNCIPMIFAAVTTVFAAGGLDKSPYCFSSVIAGILIAVATDRCIQKIIKFKHRTEQ